MVVHNLNVHVQGTSLEKTVCPGGDVASKNGDYRLTVLGATNKVLYESSFNVPIGHYDVWGPDGGMIAGGTLLGDVFSVIVRVTPRARQIVLSQGGTEIRRVRVR